MKCQYCLGIGSCTDCGMAKMRSQEMPQKEGVLDIAKEITSGDRQRDYDHPSRNFKRIARLFNAYLEGKGTEFRVDAYDVGYLMILLKVGRSIHTPKRDNLIDIAGYAHCIDEIDNEG